MFSRLSITARGCIVLVVVAMFMGGGILSAQRPDVEADHYFVGFRARITANDRASLILQGAALGKSFPEVDALEIVVRSPARLAAIQRLSNVLYVEAVPMRYALDLGDSQITAAQNNGLYGLITTKAVDAQSRGVTGFAVNVGVADTGLDYTHPDIAPNYRGGIDTVGAGDNDPFWNLDPNEVHGTHVAGTILAVNNNLGVYGVAYNANLYHARVLGPRGGRASDIMEGVRWLVEQAHCKVVNLSLGGGFPSRTEENFYLQMRNEGALIVAASGNDGARRVGYPAAYDSNIAVGAVDSNNAIADFSNQGRKLDVVGPGVMVLSSVPVNAGSEAAVTADVAYTAFGLEFAGKTPGISKILVNCGLGAPGECPSTVDGNIALIQRGTLTFGEKVTNAMNQGAVGAIIYNNVPGELTGTVGAETTVDGRAWIPAVTVSDVSGAALLPQVGTTVTLKNKASSWDTFSGTSMATPHVAGVVALVWSADPTLSNDTVESYLFSTAADLGAPGWDSTFGYGIVDASAAVALTGH